MEKQMVGNLPSALERQQEIIERLSDGRPALFLDYDGTLTPIVDDPDKANIAEQTRQVISRLAEFWTVVVLSGRALEDVRKLVGVKSIVYAGSHGYAMAGPDESFHEERGKPFRPELDKAELELRPLVERVSGARVERKPYAITVHYRKASPDVEESLAAELQQVADSHDKLELTRGKKIFEFRPKADWNKGKALLYLLKKLHVEESRTVPIYLGDDVTDEDAFAAIAERGIGIQVGESREPSSARYHLQDPGEVTAFLSVLASSAAKEPSIDIWSLTYSSYDPYAEKLRESLCAVGNGYAATRGAAPECTAGNAHYPGTYIAGIYNRLESSIEGRTVEHESMVNAPNWLPFAFSIDDGPWFDPDTASIVEYRQELDMRRGILVRTVRCEDRHGRRTTITQRRFMHMRQKHLAGLEVTVLAENWSAPMRVRSALDGRVDNTLVERYRQLNNHHLHCLGCGVTGDGLIWLQSQTTRTHIRIALAARTRLFSGEHLLIVPSRLVREEGYVGQEYDIDVREGQELRFEKIAALHTSRDVALMESVTDAMDEVRHAADFPRLLDEHQLAWSHLWDRWRIEVDAGNRRVQQILNLHIFHLLQTVSPNTVGLDAGVPPRGLHGEAYRGLIMWDELFIFPLLNIRIPDITRSLLMYRYHRLRRARWAGERLGHGGALFPWQSGSNGEEQAQTVHLNPQSGRWIPDHSRLEHHINIAIAYNIWQYYQVTGDLEFMAFHGAELFFDIARFWAGKAEYNHTVDRWEIRGVMGPDEFHDRYPDAGAPGIDNNAYINVMVAWIFCRARDILNILPERRRAFVMDDLALHSEELDRWDTIGRRLRIDFHDGGIISQFQGYGDLKEIDFEKYRERYGNIHRLDRILESEGDTPNRYKLSKQADVLMLFYLLSAEELRELFERLGYPFAQRTIPDTIDYYMKRTSHGSTLSRIVHAWVLTRSKRETAWHLFRDALESDIEDIQGGTTREGIHLGAMAGTVDLVLRCFTGMEFSGDVLWFNPALPPELKSLSFGMQYRSALLDISITADTLSVKNRVDSTATVTVGFRGTIVPLAPGEPVKLAIHGE